MKKKYFSPETAAMEVQFTSVLCGSPNDGVKDDTLGDAFGGAPKRDPKPF